MTEAEWLAATDSKPMLEFLDGKGSFRKLRLLAVGFCERIWDLLTDARSRRAINTLRRFADGRADEKEMENAVQEARWAAGAAVHSIWVAMLGRETANRASRTMGGVYIAGLEKRWKLKPLFSPMYRPTLTKLLTRLPRVCGAPVPSMFPPRTTSCGQQSLQPEQSDWTQSESHSAP